MRVRRERSAERGSPKWDTEESGAETWSRGSDHERSSTPEGKRARSVRGPEQIPLLETGPTARIQRGKGSGQIGPIPISILRSIEVGDDISAVGVKILGDIETSNDLIGDLYRIFNEDVRKPGRENVKFCRCR